MRSIFFVPSVFVAVVLLSGCGTTLVTSVDTTSSTATAVVSTSDLRKDLEKTYGSIRASIDEATPDTYFRYVQEIKDDAVEAAKFRSFWPRAQTKSALKNFAYPELSTTEFIKVEQNGDWAGYYYLTDLDQTDRLTINITRFHRVNGVWMLYPNAAVSSIPYEGGTPQERRQAIDAKIQESSVLSVIPPADDSTSSN